MRVTCPKCQFERQLDAVFVAGPRVRLACSRCGERFAVEPTTAGVVGRTPDAEAAAPARPRAPAPRASRTSTHAPSPKAARAAAGERPAEPAQGPSLERFRREFRDWFARTRNKSPYDVLGLSPDCGDADLNKAYLQLSARFSPSQHEGQLTVDEIAMLETISKRLDDALERVERKRGIRTAPERADTGREATRQPPRAAAASPPRATERPLEVPRDETAAEEAFKEGVKACRNKDWAQASRQFASCVAFDGERADYHYQLGRALLNRSFRDGSVGADEISAHLERAVEIAPNHPDYLYAVGDLAKRAGDDKTAFRYFRKALKTDPKHHDSLREIRLQKRRASDTAKGRVTTERFKAMFRRDKDATKAKAARKGKKGKKSASAADEIDIDAIGFIDA